MLPPESGTAAWLILENCSQSAAVGRHFNTVIGMALENIEQVQAYPAAFWPKPVVHPDPLTTGVNPTAALEVCKVTRHRGLRQVEDFHQIADAEFALCLQQQDDTQTNRIGEGLDGLGEMFHA